MQLSVIVLAAGQGKRMNSRLPKVLQPLGGRPLLGHVLDAASSLSPAAVHVVIGHGSESVRDLFPEADFVEQSEQLGTGHAVLQALPDVPDEHTVLVLYGDVPLITPRTLGRLVESGQQALAVLTTELEDPTGYGRILRDAAGAVMQIVEHRDARPEQLAIREINTGLLAAPADRLRAWLEKVDNDNVQGEYYLTDVIGLAAAEGYPVRAVRSPDAREVHGINDRRQLAEAEAILRSRRAARLMTEGATLADPARIDVRGEVSVGMDVLIDINVVFEGHVTLADGVEVGPNCVLRDVDLGAGTVVAPNSVLDGVITGRGCRIGPFARLRPGTHLADGARIGNFVETKQAEIGRGSKVNHLSYIGDAALGEEVNIGAGTITCNYDGANKHRTTIGDRVFVGSGTQLVAPVEIGEDATIGAGSTINKDAPARELTLSRAKQTTIKGWTRPKKNSGQ
jgi:bifunctional UDP-N-acetylglucosamine pyrophosphorylase/glucosamine-1-phosphate N-acetyltransferase